MAGLSARCSCSPSVVRPLLPCARSFGSTSYDGYFLLVAEAPPVNLPSGFSLLRPPFRSATQTAPTYLLYYTLLVVWGGGASKIHSQRPPRLQRPPRPQRAPARTTTEDEHKPTEAARIYNTRLAAEPARGHGARMTADPARAHGARKPTEAVYTPAAPTPANAPLSDAPLSDAVGTLAKFSVDEGVRHLYDDLVDHNVPRDVAES